jgi:hypothetical protein
MKEQILRIALPKLFLWNEPGRIQEYPAAMARAKGGRQYSRVEVERELFDIVPTLAYKGGAPRGRRTDGIINTYGIERSGERYRINGIDFLRRHEDGLRATPAGIALGQAYREDPGGDGWAKLLARQLLLREPRTRLLVGLLAKGFRMEVNVDGTTPSGALAVVNETGERIPIPQRNCSAFNDLLAAEAEMALGPHWRTDLNDLGATGRVVWEGVQGGKPSTNDLPTALKKALAVLFFIRLFDGDSETWVVDPGRLTEVVGNEVASSFGLAGSVESPRLSANQAFAKALEATLDAQGFAVVSQLADQFGQLLGVPHEERAKVLDSFVRTAIYHERLRILAHHAGQPRMGRGLFGENDRRRVKFDIDFGTEMSLDRFSADAQKGMGKEPAGGKQ